MSSRLAGKGACACSYGQVSNIRLRPSLRGDIGATKKLRPTTSCRIGGITSVQTRKLSDTENDRALSIPLIVGIALIPYVFAWLLLRKGYSATTRIISFGWMVIILVSVAGSSRMSPSPTPKTGSKLDIDPDRALKKHEAAVAREIVSSALKDPSSAVFGDVWGMSSTVACGSVNAKNSFGAMAGRERFILDGGKVSFEHKEAGFDHHWKKACVDRPHVAAPESVAGIRWDSRPPSNLKQYAPATDEGLAVYVPKTSPNPLEGVSVAEADFTFDHHRLFGADFYIDGEARRDAILAAYLKRYGTPQAYDEGAGSFEWKWPSGTSISIHYDANHGRTAVNFIHR